MDAPKLKLSIGTWTPERLVKLVGAMQALLICAIVGTSLLSTLSYRLSLREPVVVFFFMLPMLILSLAAFWGRAPVRLSAGMFAAGSPFWAVVGFANGSLLKNYFVGVFALAAFALSVLAFLRLPRHERW